MKVGVITFWQSNDNYGQQLQCWALQQALIRLGHDPFLIRYDADYASTRRKTTKEKIGMVITVKPLFKYLCSKWSHRKAYKFNEDKKETSINRNFKSFREEKLNVSPTIYKGINELRSHPPVADVYITGSDQVWAKLLDNPENEAFFLNFGDNRVRRIAYAPSFSMPEYPKNLRNRLRKQLSHFNAISVREETGKRICENVGVHVITVLDPTLLLSQDVYNGLIGFTFTELYLYIYHLNVMEAEELAWSQIKSYSERNGLKVKATTSSGYIPGREMLDGANYEYSTIPQWLNNIKCAQCVITPSFHGVVFSLIFHTRVIFMPLEGPRGRGNNRVIDLFKKLGLDFFIYDRNVPIEEYFVHPIDWIKVDNQLDDLRTMSLNFLQSNIV
jgi:hypothetical protein